MNTNTSKNNVDNFGAKEKQDGQCAALLLFCPHIEDNCVDNHNILIVLTKQYRRELWTQKLPDYYWKQCLKSTRKCRLLF
nr:MAG TPA: hypothetical protein [Caudoviricetes sp.]